MTNASSTSSLTLPAHRVICSAMTVLPDPLAGTALAWAGGHTWQVHDPWNPRRTPTGETNHTP